MQSLIGTDEHTVAFNKLKKAMTTEPICLSFPNWNDDIVLITDASRLGCGYIIANEDAKGVQRVIAYGGRQWTKHESKYSVSELELAAVLYGIESNSQYFIGRKFKIYTDHISNTWVRNLKHSQGRLYRWSLRMQNYMFDIFHLKGSTMPADFLSRTVEQKDEQAADLEDDSALVFTIGAANEQDRGPTSATPTVCRPLGGRRTTIITWQNPESTTDTSSARQSHAPTRQTPDEVLQLADDSLDPLNLSDQQRTSDFEHITAGTAQPPVIGHKLNGYAPQPRYASVTPIGASGGGATNQLASYPRVTTDADINSIDSRPPPVQTPTIYELQPDQTLAKQQRDSPDLCDMIRYLETGTLPTDNHKARFIIQDADNWFLDEHSVLYHIHNPRRRNVNSIRPVITQLVVPANLRQRILEAFHDNLGHYRLDKCYMTIQNYYYWKGLYASVREYLKNCVPCQRSSQRPPKPAPLQHAPLLGVMERLVVDHIQMPKCTHPLTNQSTQYCLTLVDQASNWCTLIPVPDCSARTTALAIQHHWIPQHGLPRSLHSDLGPCFTSQLFKELCKIYNIDHTTAASQNHKSVSRAESIHRMILSGLRKLCIDDLDWPSKLPGLLLALHTTVVTTIGLSPAYMLYHRELRLPIMATVPIHVESKDKTLTELVETTRVTDRLLHDNTEHSFSTADKYYNKKAVTPTYNLHDTVLLYDEHIPAGEMKKLHCFYRPVEVVECLPHYTYRLKDLNTNRILPFKVHASRLKPLHNLQHQPHTATAQQQDALPSSRANEVPSVHRHDKSHTTDAFTDIQTQSTPTGTRREIHRIRARRRRGDGSYQYQVQFTDDTTNWLCPRDIPLTMVRKFNAAKRRRRM